MGMQKENDRSNIGQSVMALAKDGYKDGASIPTERVHCMISPTPANDEARATPPTVTKFRAGILLDMPPKSQKLWNTKADRPASPSSESTSSDDDTKNDKYNSFFLDWLAYQPDSKRMLDHVLRILVHHKRMRGNNAALVIQ